MAEKYKFLNPVGMKEGVDTFPLAPRLDTIDGKTIVFSGSGEADVVNPLWERLNKDYPNVNWIKKQTYTTNPHEITEEEKKTCDGLIQGVAW